MNDGRPTRNGATRRWAWGLLGAALAALLLQPQGSLNRSAAAGAFQREDLWYGVYLGQAKIGYQGVSLFPDRYQDPFDKLRASRDVQAVRSFSSIRIGVLGVTVEQTIRVHELLDEEGAPLYLEYAAESGQATQKVTARFYPDRIQCTINMGGNETQKTIPIPPGVHLRDPDFSEQLRTLPPGTRKSFHYFEPIGLRIREGFVEALGEETSTVDGRPARLAKVSFDIVGGKMTTWVDERGRPVRMEGPLGIRLVLEPASEARSSGGSPLYTPPPDLAVAAAIPSSGAPITSPRSLRELTVRLTGVPKRELLISDFRQEVSDVTSTDGKFDATMRIATEPAPPSPTPLAGAAEPAAPSEDELGEALQPSQYVDSDHPDIVAQARRIAPDATDAFEYARAIARWVNEHITARGDMGLPRLASDVLKTRSGVCRDYAALYVALARARGIPSRMAIGVAYWEDGFYYHAWAESYVGTWIAFDPTQAPGYPVDATHIKFAQGDAASILDVIPIVGEIGIEVTIAPARGNNKMKPQMNAD